MIGGSLSSVVILGGFCALLAVTLSLRHIYLHLKFFYVPEYQRHIVRILAMVPVYSTTSWLALVVESERIVLCLEFIRDSYESYVIYNFVVLLTEYSGGDLHICRYLENRPRMVPPFPGNLWFPPMKLGPKFYNNIRASVLQFVIVKPLGSFAKIYMYLSDGFRMQVLISFIITIVNNISIAVAMYGLVLFYHAVHDLLMPFRPFEKFLSVKAVVFFSFWQGVVLTIAVNTGYIADVEGFSANDQATGLQDFLILFEMMIASFAHYFVFSHKEYRNNLGQDFDSDHETRNPLLQVFDFRDVIADARDRLQGGVGHGTEMRKENIYTGETEEISKGAKVLSSSYLSDADGPEYLSVSHDLLSTPWRLSAVPENSLPGTNNSSIDTISSMPT